MVENMSLFSFLGFSPPQNVFLKILPLQSIHCCEETGFFPSIMGKKITKNILHMFLGI